MTGHARDCIMYDVCRPGVNLEEARVIELLPHKVIVSHRINSFSPVLMAHDSHAARTPATLLGAHSSLSSAGSGALERRGEGLRTKRGIDMAKKIYVGNMNYNTSEDTLRQLFAQYGEVVSVKCDHGQVHRTRQGLRVRRDGLRRCCPLRHGSAEWQGSRRPPVEGQRGERQAPGQQQERRGRRRKPQPVLLKAIWGRRRRALAGPPFLISAS